MRIRPVCKQSDSYRGSMQGMWIHLAGETKQSNEWKRLP